MKLKQVQDAGTAALLNVGDQVDQILQLDGNAKLPAVDGSNLTNITGSGGGTGVRNMTSITIPSGGGTSIPSNLPNGTFIHVINTIANNLILYLPPAGDFDSGYYLPTAHYSSSALSGDSPKSVRLTPDGSDSLDGDSGSTFLSLSRDSYTVVSNGTDNWMTLQRGRT